MFSHLTNNGELESFMASPIKFAHVVLKSPRYAEMLEWWLDFLEGSVRYGNDFISFLDQVTCKSREDAYDYADYDSD